MTDFFISYTHVDRSWAEWIAWQLEEAGYTTVLQAWDFRPGNSFVQAMQQAAVHAERTIAVLSPDYLTSHFTHLEWEAAFARDPSGEQGALLPVRVRACHPQGLLQQMVYIDLVELDETAAIATLSAGVRRGRVKPTTAPRFPGSLSRAVPERPCFPGTVPGRREHGDDDWPVPRVGIHPQVTRRHHASLQRLGTWLACHKRWLFSGLGTALLIALLSYFFAWGGGEGNHPAAGRDVNTITAPSGSAIIQTDKGTITFEKGEQP